MKILYKKRKKDKHLALLDPLAAGHVIDKKIHLPYCSLTIKG